MGGGKAMLEVKSGVVNSNNKERVSEMKKKDKYEMMLESCLKKGRWGRN